MAKKLYDTEEGGFLKVSVELNAKALKKLTALWEKDYCLYATLQIEFNLEDPISGGRFLTNSENEPYFLKDSQIGLSRCLFPCLDSFSDYYKISTLRVGCDRPNFEVFALGK